MGLSDHAKAPVMLTGNNPGGLRQAETGFRAFSPDDFSPTPSWRRLERILGGNGGCYGLYGPRGSGKSWLMLNAIYYASKKGGMGLWFPCPSKYDANAFLSSLSDNLASAIERRFVSNDLQSNIVAAARRILIAIFAIPLAIAIIVFLVRSLSGRAISDSQVIALLPIGLWITALVALYLLIPLYALQFFRSLSSSGRLARDATALRERIRFTANLKSGAELGVGGNTKPFAASFRRSREKALAERPTTIASLVFDFRNLAEAMANVMAPIVIGIDELDKLPDPDEARSLLRDIKGIFEVTGVSFLVSVSEEAAAALQLGTLQVRGRNEFNSSFYTIIELPPLQEDLTRALLKARGYDTDEDQTYALCLVSAGNQRDLVRIADATLGQHADPSMASDGEIISLTMKEESSALLTEIIRYPVTSDSKPVDEKAKSGAWLALSPEYFKSIDSFVSLGREAISKYWAASWQDASWARVSEPWRRLLVRLFVSAKWLELFDKAHSSHDSSVRRSIFEDLLKVMIMAGQDAGVARLMLEIRFGGDLNGEYHAPSGEMTEDQQ